MVLLSIGTWSRIHIIQPLLAPPTHASLAAPVAAPLAAAASLQPGIPAIIGNGDNHKKWPLPSLPSLSSLALWVLQSHAVHNSLFLGCVGSFVLACSVSPVPSTQLKGEGCRQGSGGGGGDGDGPR